MDRGGAQEAAYGGFLRPEPAYCRRSTVSSSAQGTGFLGRGGSDGKRARNLRCAFEEGSRSPRSSMPIPLAESPHLSPSSFWVSPSVRRSRRRTEKAGYAEYYKNKCSFAGPFPAAATKPS